MSKTKKDDTHALLQRGLWFSRFDPDTQARIEMSGRTRHVRRNEMFIRQGEPASGLYAVLDGQVRGVASAPSGRATLLVIFHPGDFFSHLAALDGRPHSLDHCASVDTTLFHLPQHAVREIFHGDQRLFMALAEPQLGQVRKVVEYLSTTVRLSPLQRLAERLVDFSRSPYFPNGEHLPLLGLSQELLASSIMCTRQTTNELLGELQKLELISSEYGRIDILNPEGLKKLFVAQS